MIPVKAQGPEDYSILNNGTEEDNKHKRSFALCLRQLLTELEVLPGGPEVIAKYKVFFVEGSETSINIEFPADAPKEG